MYVSVKKRKKRYKILLCYLLIFILLLSLFMFGDSHLRKILNDYSKSAGKTLLISVANEAVSELLKENKITYGKIVTLSRDSSGNVTSLEIGIEQLNMLRSQIAVKIDKKLFERSDYPLSIPIGTIIGNEYTLGRGPEIKFNMRLTSTVVADFESVFTSAGINQVLHQIVIRLNMSGKALIPWYNTSFTTEMTCIAAQTVIVGATPDSFTNVEDSDKEDVAEDIFNFADN